MQEPRARLTYSQKNANGKQWYKDWADYLINRYISHDDVFRINIRKHIKVNYDLFNNRVDLKELEYVCKPYGMDMENLPAKMQNRDIVSPKIKALLGMELKRPFAWKVKATNPEATNRKEQKYFQMIKEWVIGEIMKPIYLEIKQKYQEQMLNRELRQDEREQLIQQMDEEINTKTPEEVKRYMDREYQDPAEQLAEQLLNYYSEKLMLKDKFNNGYKHLLLSGYEIYYISTFNDEIDVWEVNPLNFYHIPNTASNLIEDSEQIVVEYWMTPSEIVKYFGKELSNKDIDDIYDSQVKWKDNYIIANMFTSNNYDYLYNRIPVYHCVWKALRKIKFLKYVDYETGQEMETIVDEDYTINKEAGDISVESVWIPEIYETWVINNDKYVFMRPVPGQFVDVNNIYHPKMPYYGVVVDNTNSIPTSLMDRLKPYQWFYNIVMYRLEYLLASDKGKKVLINISSLPKDENFDLEKWLYYFEASPIMFFDSKEEGIDKYDANTVGKYIDLSLASDIQKYINLAEYIRRQAGIASGVTERVEGEVAPREAVTNIKQSLIQSSYILEGYFNVHDLAKKHLLQALIDKSKWIYHGDNAYKLQFVLDDLSLGMLDSEDYMLDNNTFGIFVSNSSELFEQQEIIKQLAHAALQTQTIDFSDLIRILKSDNVQFAEEIIKEGERRRQQQQQQQLDIQREIQNKQLSMQQQLERQKHEWKLQEIRVEGDENRRTEILKLAIMGASFNPDLDKNRNRINDFLELYKQLSENDLKLTKLKMDKEKFDKKYELEKEKIKIMKEKNKKQ